MKISPIQNVGPYLGALLLSACSGGSAPSSSIDAEFQFETTAEVQASIGVLVDGLPTAGVQLQVCTPFTELPPEGSVAVPGEIFFQGVTDATGSCDLLLKLPTTLEEVDLVVQHRGSVGPYTLSGLADLWGPFAPSARQTFLISDLDGARVELMTAPVPLAPPQYGSGSDETPDLFTPVPNALIETIGDVLPEQSSAGAAFVSETYTPNLVFSETATVQVIFVWEGAGYRNTLGWFTYRDESDGSVAILSSDLLIPDASFPSVGTAAIGDTYDLKDLDGEPRIFQPGDKVGFFVIADGWNQEPLVKNWDATAVAIPSNDPAVNGSFGRGCYTSISKLNPEFALGAIEQARHLAMIWLPAEEGFLGGEPHLVSGFEDLLRTGNSDDDFNDLVFIVTATPIAALAETEAFVYEEGDPDLDGVSGISDHYPTDGDRAFVTRYPQNGENVVGMEDLYPIVGDADFNDAVIAYHVEQVTNANGDLTELMMTYHLVGRGAGYDHAIGVHLPGLPEGTQGSIEIERVFSDGEGTVQFEDPRTIADFMSTGSRIDDVFPSTWEALKPLPGMTFTNTQFGVIDRPAGSARVLFRFDTPVDPTLIGTAPYDLYLLVKQGEELWDVHFPGVAGFDDRPAHLPVEEGATSFLDDNGNPWLLEVPGDWRFPIEKVRVWDAYPEFNTWVASEGAKKGDWYDAPTPAAGFLSETLLEYIPTQSWAVSLPQP